MLRFPLLAITLLASAGPSCADRRGPPHGDSTLQTADGAPDEVPLVLNGELPFRYPLSLYEKKVQGNVTLRLFVDRDGHVRPESTRVEESSGFTSLDSAAVQGSHELRFVPAKSGGDPVAVPILFPVYFRHPEAAPLPGDTVLKARGVRREARESMSGAAARATEP